MISTWWQAYLTPPASAVKFAIKATLAMLLALYLALWCDLDRPYWALISAAFLQIRPMSGMVFEKGLSQITGTAIGCLVGIGIMAAFVQAAIPALTSLTLWIMLCTYAASLTRNNASYGCIMAAVTAMLIVIITASSPGGMFGIAVARLSELSLGALCATLVSSLLWPIKVRDHLADLADNVVNQAFLHGAERLENSDDITELQRTLIASLGPLTQLETDSQAARYEGPEGNGRIRASHVLTRRTLRLMAILHALQQLLRFHGDGLPQRTRELATDIASGLRESAHSSGVPQARARLQALRHRALTCLEQDAREAERDGATPTPTPTPTPMPGHDDVLRDRVTLGLREALGHALVILDAREAIHTPRDKRLRAAKLAWHRDHLAAGLNALRAGIVFAVLATFWVLTSWDNGQVAMLLGTLFSAFFASRDNPATVAMMFAKGMVAAIPSAFLFGHVLLSQASGFAMLALLFMPPLFLGLLGAANPKLMGYCLAFTIGNILLTMPGNGMDFSFDSFINRAIAVMIGLAVVVMAFRMIPGFSSGIRKRRLVGATVHDLKGLLDRPPSEAEARFSGRMADRLLQLAGHDDLLPDDQRYLFTLGLTGLDLGYASLHLRRRLEGHADQRIADVHRALHRGLVDDYAASARGELPSAAKRQGQALLRVLDESDHLTLHQRRLTAGLIERLTLSLTRQAERSRAALDGGNDGEARHEAPTTAPRADGPTR